jgi:hypothetical protein
MREDAFRWQIQGFVPWNRGYLLPARLRKTRMGWTSQ